MSLDSSQQALAPTFSRAVVIAVVVLMLMTAMVGIGAAHEGDHDGMATDETDGDVATEETPSETIPGFTGIAALVALIAAVILGIRRY